jgi:ElaA protein
MTSTELTPRVAALGDMDSLTLYGLLRLRVDVFVVEQACRYAELDGRDPDPATVHMWLEGDAPDRPVAYLRVLDEPEGCARIGRVAVARDARGAGLAGRLVEAAVNRIGDRPCVLDAQSHLVGFYEQFGFVATGPEFVEDGIPHVPMRREPQDVAPVARRAAGQGSAARSSSTGLRRPV